jgi:hypothetical protein
VLPSGFRQPRYPAVRPRKSLRELDSLLKGVEVVEVKASTALVVLPKRGLARLASLFSLSTVARLLRGRRVSMLFAVAPGVHASQVWCGGAVVPASGGRSASALCFEQRAATEAGSFLRASRRSRWW